MSRSCSACLKCSRGMGSKREDEEEEEVAKQNWAGFPTTMIYYTPFRPFDLLSFFFFLFSRAAFFFFHLDRRKKALPLIISSRHESHESLLLSTSFVKSLGYIYTYLVYYILQLPTQLLSNLQPKSVRTSRSHQAAATQRLVALFCFKTSRAGNPFTTTAHLGK